MKRLVFALLFVASTAWAGKRDALAKELLDLLAAKKIAVTILEQTDDTLTLDVNGGKAVIALENLELHLAEATGAAERAAVFEKFAGGVQEMGRKPVPLRRKKDGRNILPRLVSADYLANLIDVVHQPLGDTGLHVTWVHDREGSVRYLVGEDLKSLGLKLPALDALARKNLASTTPVEMLRGGLTQLVVVRQGDSFDAARLLLVPAALKKGEAVQAAVPDRDLLVLGPLPDDDDWTGYREAAKAARADSAPDVPGLLDRPLRVTRDGFELK